MDKVKANRMDLVFDKSGMSLNGVEILMYAPENTDFTSDVINALNKGAKPAAASSPAKP